MGTVYLIHFDIPFWHARHYVGYTDNLEGRLEMHKKGQGARLIQVIQEAMIDWEVVRVWENEDREFERFIKNTKNTAHYCPICRKKRRRWR